MKPISYTDPFNYNFRMNYSETTKRWFRDVKLPKDIWVIYSSKSNINYFPRNGIDSNIVVRSIRNGS